MKIDAIIKQLSPLAEESCKIEDNLFKEYDVKRGLRNADHTGVLVGLTKVGSVVGSCTQGLTPSRRIGRSERRDRRGGRTDHPTPRRCRTPHRRA